MTHSRLSLLDAFAHRHLGPNDSDTQEMLQVVGFPTLDALTHAAVPESIQLGRALNLPPAATETEALRELAAIAQHNTPARSYIGAGYADTITPAVILRNILENPGWYTQYTPYQAEIAQGRLEALFNFQTMVSDLTGLPIANASLLDEATAAAEAMALCYNAARKKTGSTLLVHKDCHPQTLAVLHTRAEPLGIEIRLCSGHEDPKDWDLSAQDVFAVLLPYPTTQGHIHDWTRVAQHAHDHKALVIVTADILSLALLTPPGEWGADIVVGNTQRFGVPMGYGGPHAAFFATTDAHKRRIPGRIVGLTVDAEGNPALRLALQTREQHIRRDRATSNICTSQVLLAIVASMYAVYHGPDGVRAIAERVHTLAAILSKGLRQLGLTSPKERFFDTLHIIAPTPEDAASIRQRATDAHINLRHLSDTSFSVTLDETTTPDDLLDLWHVFSGLQPDFTPEDLLPTLPTHTLPTPLQRTTPPLTHPIFLTHHSETKLLRYIHKLQSRDLSLTTSMIPLGSCTMKLNATSEMIPVTWPSFSKPHPFAPLSQNTGYLSLFTQLESMLGEITGLPGVSLQPNAGSQGEYAGLLVIRRYHKSRNDTHRDICLIPTSAHGTNPASAVMAGMRVVPVTCDEDGNIDLADLRALAEKHADNLGALMITYPSTHGVFERTIQEICAVVHEFGGQVYMDGANMNAQVGLCRPGDVGADVCHLNLHKTFCIPHGGGGPGMGPIAVAPHLTPFLPTHPLIPTKDPEHGISPVSAAPWGSPSILPISWSYIRMMGPDGLKTASQLAILNANYIAKRLSPFYPILYTDPQGLVAHECIIDLRPFKKSANVSVADIAKRLIDYGFHAPTVSWPVAGTMMIEPTESEALDELDRFCDAMISIYAEIQSIAEGTLPQDDNPLVNAPHTAACVTADTWSHPYSRRVAAYPATWLNDHKFWPVVRRVNDAHGDRNLVCCRFPDDLIAATEDDELAES